MEDDRVSFVHKTHTHKKSCQKSQKLSSFYHSYLIEKLAQLNEQKETTMDSILNIICNKNQLSEYNVGFIRSNKPDIE